MGGNTRPKLLEVSNGRMPKHNKGLVTISSPRTLRSTAHTENAHATVVSRPSMLNIGQTASALWTNHLALRRGQTKTEIDEDGDGRRQRQTKTETDGDGDGRRRKRAKTETDEDGDSR